MQVARQLIAYDTTSHHSNLNMIDYLVERCKELGAEVVLYTDETGKKANLFATMGPHDVGGLMLSGHTDVVPVVGQNWDTDPFVLTAAQGRFYGRGVADMKIFICQALLTANAFKHQTFKQPLHLAFTYDEEVGCHGARRMMEQRSTQDHVLPKCALIGEPTNFQVFRMHKGMHAVQVRIKGVEGHSSGPNRGANAIEQLSLVMQKIGEISHECRQKTSLESFFELPYTTINMGLIQGGTALNIIPNQARLDFEYRTIPDQDPQYVFQQIQGYAQEVLLPNFKKQQPQVDIEVEMMRAGPPMIAPENTAIEQLALRLTGNVTAGAAPFYTEGAIYNEAGIPTVVCGPGDIAQAHRPNEFITQEQLEKGVPFLSRLVEESCFA